MYCYCCLQIHTFKFNTLRYVCHVDTFFISIRASFPCYIKYAMFGFGMILKHVFCFVDWHPKLVKNEKRHWVVWGASEMCEYEPWSPEMEDRIADAREEGGWWLETADHLWMWWRQKLQCTTFLYTATTELEFISLPPKYHLHNHTVFSYV